MTEATLAVTHGSEFLVVVVFVLGFVMLLVNGAQQEDDEKRGRAAERNSPGAPTDHSIVRPDRR